MEKNALGEQLVQRTIHSIDYLANTPEGTGLALITLPTGFGKTTNVPEGLARKIASDPNAISKVFAITQANNNLYNFKTKFQNSWKKNGLDPTKILLIPATDKPFRAFWEKSEWYSTVTGIFDKNGLNEQLIRQNISKTLQQDRKFSNIVKEMLSTSKDLAAKLTFFYNKNIDQSLKPTRQEISDLVRIQKKQIKKYVYFVISENEPDFDKASLKEKLKIYNSFKSLSWVKELFPIMKIPDNDVILMSASRFTMSWDLIVESLNNGYQTDKVDSLIGNSPVLVIDEIDQLAATINSAIIEDTVKGSISSNPTDANDLIDLTKTIITRLRVFFAPNSDSFPSDIISLFVEELETLRKDFKELEQFYSEYELDKGRSLDPDLTKAADQFFFVSSEQLQQLSITYQLSGKSIMYEYGDYITKSNHNRTLFSVSSKERKQEREKNGSKASSMTILLALLHKLNRKIWEFLYYHRNDKNESKRDFVIRFLESIGSDTKVQGVLKLLSGVPNGFNIHTIKNKDTVYNRGFDIYVIHPRKDEEGRYHNDDPKLYWYYVPNTAEKHLLDMTNHYKVIGCSATADIKTTLNNFDFSFIKSELEDRFCNAKTLPNDLKTELNLLEQKNQQWKLQNVQPITTVMPAGNRSYAGKTILQALEELELFPKNFKNFKILNKAFMKLGNNELVGMPLTLDSFLNTDTELTVPITQQRPLSYDTVKKLNLLFAILLFLKNVSPTNSNRSMAMLFNSFSNFNPDRDSIVLDAITDIIKIYLSTRPDLKAYLDQGSNVISISSWRNYDADSMIQIMRADDINNHHKALAKVKEKLKDGKNVRIIISMYNTLGTGQDLDYAFDKICLNKPDLKNVNPGDRPDIRHKDFDCLYIEKPTYITMSIKSNEVASSKNDDLTTKFATAHMEMQRRFNSVDSAYFSEEFTKNIADLNSYIQANGKGQGPVWSQNPANDECNATWSKLLQAVGRMNRTYYKVQQPLLMLDPKLKDYCSDRSIDDYCNTIDVLKNTNESGYQYTTFSPLENALIKALSGSSIVKVPNLIGQQIGQEERYNLKAIEKLSRADKKDGRAVNYLATNGFYAEQKAAAIKDIHMKRKQALEHPSLNSEDYELLPQNLQSLYMRQKNLPAGSPIAYSYTLSADQNMEYQRLSDNPDANNNVFKISVPDINQVLHLQEILMVAPELRKIFEHNHWATELTTNDYQLSPLAVKTYLQGAYGEIIIKWWFKTVLGLNLKSFSQDEALAPYELMFDFVSPNFENDGLAIDAKFYTGKSPVKEYFDKRKQKFNHDIFKRFLYLNVFVKPDNEMYGVTQDLTKQLGLGKPVMALSVYDLKNHRFLTDQDSDIKQLKEFLK
ncbi:hypothetical protein ACLUWZ_06510 [Limosilactobacillus mucosae]|uniref:hypothetical protein n=1 Tax=Limosilactobacillus mucosae TaxID=97478 RepID=UPI0039967DA0